MANQHSTSRRYKILTDACAKYPSAGNRTLAKKLHAQHPLLFSTLNSASCAVRNFRGNKGVESKRYAAKRGTQRPNGKAGELPPLPTSEATGWEPYTIDARRVLVLSDLHLPYHSEVALDAALEYGDSFKPDAILLNGDVFDFYQLSRYDRDPTKPKILAELAAGRQLFAHLKARFGVPVHFRYGNHEERFDKYLFIQAPLLFEIDYANRETLGSMWHGPAGIRENRVKVIQDQPIMLGRLPVFHGHELGRSLFSPVNPARGAFLRAHHTILVGHSHQTSGHADTNIWHDETFCWSTGCLCELTPPYARANRWNWGFACVTVEKDGSFNVENLRIAKDGKVRKS